MDEEVVTFTQNVVILFQSFERNLYFEIKKLMIYQTLFVNS